MSRLTGALILAFVLCWGSVESASVLPNDPAAFEEYLMLYNKVYSLVEKVLRLQTFAQNVGKINEMNSVEDDQETPAGKEKCEFGLNNYTDWNFEEFSALINLKANNKVHKLFERMEEWRAPENLTAPAKFDWREKNKVTPVKNQGSCGSCWSFAATANIESLNAINKNEMPTFSEQQLLDCDRRSNGCNGGWPETAIQSVIDYGGQNFANKYPYEGRKGMCRFQKNAVGVKVSKNLRLRSNDEQGMAQHLSSTGTFINLVDARALQHYRSGILNPTTSQCDNSQNGYNHALITVAYGQADGRNGMPFWVLKNSWGTGWGEKGYARIRRGTNACGLANHVNTAVLA